MHAIQYFVLVPSLSWKKVTMARKQQHSLKAIATQVVKPKETQATPAKERVGRQDVKTPVRKDVTLRAEEITHGGRLTKAPFAQLKKDFPTQDLKKNFITKQLKMYCEQKAKGQLLSMIDWSRKRNTADVELSSLRLLLRRS